MTQVLQRLIFSAERDPELMPLYAEGHLVIDSAAAERAKFKSYERTSAVLEAGSYASFATYFNAFAASYWFSNTPVNSVDLHVVASGKGHIYIHRSSAKADCYRIDTIAIDGTVDTTVTLPLAKFLDGGWYWIDAEASSEDLHLKSVTWETNVTPRVDDAKVTVAITTFNRPTDCVKALEQMSQSDSLRQVLKEIVVVDQGNQNVVDESIYPQVAESLGSQLRVITQPNLGGSGGFSRGMHEAVHNDSDFVILIDDDVKVEPEGIVRAATFASFCEKETIVGGHMFSMYNRTLLHAFAESVNLKTFWWGPVPSSPESHDFAEASLRTTEELHTRWRGSYNGWWMCMIPTSVVKKLGYSLPFFIKWDDSEYGLRAGKAGVPTVSLPGVSVWHVPWTDKDDSLDWQAYFHEHNRVVAALLHSPLPRGGDLLLESIKADVKHLYSQQYSVVALRHKALRDVLSGPDRLHKNLASVVPSVRKLQSNFTDTQIKKSLEEFPAERSSGKMPKQYQITYPTNPLQRAFLLAKATVRNLTPVTKLSRKYPEMYVPFKDAEWAILSQLDSAVVTNSDGSGASFYQRDPKLYAELAKETVALHMELARKWASLSTVYREALPTLVSEGEWVKTFGISNVSQPAPELTPQD